MRIKAFTEDAMQQRTSAPSTPKVLGYITTGYKDAQGKNHNVDYCVLPDNLRTWMESQGLDPKPKSLDDIYLIADTPEGCYYDEYVRGGKSQAGKWKVLCHGSDVTGVAKEITQTGEWKEIECKGDECPHRKCTPQKCHPSIKLYFFIPDYPEFGVFVAQSHGISSGSAIVAGLNSVYSSLGHLQMIPMKLSVEPFQAKIPGGGQQTKYKFTLTCNRSFRAVMSAAQAASASPAMFAISGSGAIEPEPLAEQEDGEQVVESAAEPVVDGQQEEIVDAEYESIDTPGDGETSSAPKQESKPEAPKEEKTDTRPGFISPAEVDLLDSGREGLISDETWLAVLKKRYPGNEIRSTADIPAKVNTKVNGKDALVDSYTFWCEAIGKQKKTAEAKENAQAKCCSVEGCGNTEDLKESGDGTYMCGSCRELYGS